MTQRLPTTIRPTLALVRGEMTEEHPLLHVPTRDHVVRFVVENFELVPTTDRGRAVIEHAHRRVVQRSA